MSDRFADDPRVTRRTKGEPDPDGTCVVYWMQRAQRAWDNPALDTAIALGNALAKPVVVFFGLHAGVTGGNLRHYQFLAEGLPDIAAGLRERRVGFVLRRHPDHRLLPFADEVRPALVVGDENPLRQAEGWRERVAVDLRIPLWTVDADVVVPSGLLDKEQYAARTIRPRLERQLNRFLVASREPVARVQWRAPRGARLEADAGRNPDALLEGLPIDRTVQPVTTFRGGTAEARRRLHRFVRARLEEYATDRNHPDRAATSELSPYLHFGHIGPREVGLAVRDSGADPAAVAAFLEQLIVRRELAINYVTYNRRYDSLDGCERWARLTLAGHRRDRRPHVYSDAEFEAAETHDPLWNAAQRQMITTGWMHGYIRMYWAKKILEWSTSPEQAFALAVRLNDRYELDGRDPNGYANIAWAIGGKHDRPWPPRPVYGTIRSMSAASTRRKFDADAYIARHATGQTATSRSSG
jgi:deoxyribodipyrimidine photo-lyase